MEDKSNKEVLEGELKQKKAIEVTVKSEGGQIIERALRVDLFNSITRLTADFKTVSHAELIALAANIRSKMDLLTLFTGIEDANKLLAEEYDKLLKEEDL